jgi:hypothetical protein
MIQMPFSVLIVIVCCVCDQVVLFCVIAAKSIVADDPKFRLFLACFG